MIYLNPLMPDTVIVCDMSFQPLGTLTRSIRTGRNMDQVEAMFQQRSRLKAAMEAPVKRALQPVVDRRDAVRTLNADLISQARNVTPNTITKPTRPARATSIDPFAATLTPAAAPTPEADPFL